MRGYNLVKGSLHEQFLNCQDKVIIYGGGFANGKTAAACIKALRWIVDYPGCNGLIARSTYPKLNDTIKKEFLKWCPTDWIKRHDKTANIIEFKNGSCVNFRYIEQQGVNANSTTSNLLSATFDWAIVDQVDDPQISHKDFIDLLGRMRGSTPYIGNNPDAPRTGPRQVVLTCNPTRNWVYQKLVQPLKDHELGKYNPDLLCEKDKDGKDVLYCGKRKPMIRLFEGSTYTNAYNLEKDFIETLESAYQGDMRERFLLGKWVAWEGLVYPQFNTDIHVIDEELMNDMYMKKLLTKDYVILEGYDHGLACPSAYLLGYCDEAGNIHIIAEHYKSEMRIEDHVTCINAIRARYAVPKNHLVLADPALFRRHTVATNSLEQTVSGIFFTNGIIMTRGNNDIKVGINKIQQYLALHKFRKNPYTLLYNAPILYISSACTNLINEINSYYWKKGTNDSYTDVPVDKDDHALDALKYLLTNRPNVDKILEQKKSTFKIPTTWQEVP